jgi:hypothetical protein
MPSSPLMNPFVITLNIMQWYMRALLNRLTALLLALRIGDLLVYGLFK